MNEIKYGIEDIDKIDWLTHKEASGIFAQYPGIKLKRPSAIGYKLLDLPVPLDLLADDDTSWLS